MNHANEEAYLSAVGNLGTKEEAVLFLHLTLLCMEDSVTAEITGYDKSGKQMLYLGPKDTAAIRLRDGRSKGGRSNEIVLTAQQGNRQAPQFSGIPILFDSFQELSSLRRLAIQWNLKRETLLIYHDLNFTFSAQSNLYRLNSRGTPLMSLFENNTLSNSIQGNLDMSLFTAGMESVYAYDDAMLLKMILLPDCIPLESVSGETSRDTAVEQPVPNLDYGCSMIAEQHTRQDTAFDFLHCMNLPEVIRQMSVPRLSGTEEILRRKYCFIFHANTELRGGEQ